MQALNPYDLQWCVRLLPHNLRALMKKEEITVGGGYIRSCIFREKVNDIDLFTPFRNQREYTGALDIELTDQDDEEAYVRQLAEKLKVGMGRVIETENALTVTGNKYPIQFITRWVYDHPVEVLPSFDFTICQAVFWWDHYCDKWLSACSNDFYADLAAKRLIYTIPDREEDAGGSILRVLKYYQKGFRITIPSLANVIGRIAAGVRYTSEMVDSSAGLNTPYFTKIVKGLLREVDPNIDPEHIIEEEENGD